MVYEGRIYDIVIVSDFIAQIILKKKNGNKVVNVAIKVMGFWKDKALNELKIKVKDKIRGKMYLESREYNGKWYTDAIFKEIYILQAGEVSLAKFGKDMFEPAFVKVDLNTGEVL